MYQLGAVLYKLFTGRPPFEGENAFEIIEQIKDDQPTPPSDVADGLPSAIDEILLTALAKEKQDRYEDALALLDQLQMRE